MAPPRFFSNPYPPKHIAVYRVSALPKRKIREKFTAKKIQNFEKAHTKKIIFLEMFFTFSKVKNKVYILCF